MNSAVSFASTDVKSNIIEFYVKNSSVWTVQTLKFWKDNDRGAWNFPVVEAARGAVIGSTSGRFELFRAGGR